MNGTPVLSKIKKPEQAPGKKRLQPEERKEMLLECTASFLREHGIASLTMDGLALYAGVSKPLVYNYFPNRMALLKALLVREVNLRKELDRKAAEESSSFEEFIENASWTLLQHIQDRGNIIQQLMQEPEVVLALSEIRASSRGSYVDYVAKMVTKNFDIPPSVASIAVELAMGMGTTAGAHSEREKDDIKKVHDILVTLTNGALQAIVEKYGKKRKARR